jgi:translocation and assembly module TamA
MTRWRKLPRFLLVPLVIALPFAAQAEVHFTGLDEELEKNARALMAIAAVPCETSVRRVEGLYRDADSELRSALEALGHYRYQLDKDLSFEDAECWRAQFEIALGEPVTIREVTVAVIGEGSDDEEISGQLELQPQVGEILNHGRYESFKRVLISNLTIRGYFDAEMVESRVTVDEGLQFADLVLRADSGPRYRFGEVTFSESALNQELLAGYIKFEQGDPYDAGKIAELHELLNGSGYFSSVSIRAEPEATLGLDVPVRVATSPGKRRVFTTGAGYATDTGLQGRLGYTNRRRNSAGHQFDVNLFLSSVDSEFTGNYRWPRGRPDAEWVDIYGGFLRKRTDTSESDKRTLGIRLTRNRSETWLESPYIELTNEEFQVGEQLDTSKLLVPGIKWETTIGRTLRRQPQGHRLSLDIHGAHEDLLSDTTFLQATASAKWITTLGSATRLLARADLGVTAKQSIDDLPATVRFFAGGDTSVRGYDFETIGPVDEEGNVIGGAHQVVLSLEADWQVREDWALAVFVDSGSAFIDSVFEFSTGVGLGLRWFSPVGPIRVDIAHPLDDPDNDFRFHITLGPDL